MFSTLLAVGKYLACTPRPAVSIRCSRTRFPPLCLSVMMNECVSGKNMLLRQPCLGSWCLPAVFFFGYPEWTGGICFCKERANLAIVFVSSLQETDLIVIVPWLMLWFSMVAVDFASKWLRTHSTVCIPVFQFCSDFSSNFHCQKSHKMDLQG